MQAGVIGAAASTVEVAITQPLDYGRTRWQLGKPFCIKDCYRGVGPRFLSALPVRATFWGVQDAMLQLSGSPITAGIVGGCAQTLVEVPFEVLKIRQMKGVSGGRNGLTITGMMCGVQWHMARNICTAVGAAGGRHMTKGCDPTTQAVGTALSTALAAVVSHPLDTLKTRAQGQSPALRTRNLMVGVWPRALQCSIAMAIGACALAVQPSGSVSYTHLTLPTKA